VLQSRDIGAAQRRVQKYFVNGSPDQLRTHFDVTARQAPGGGYLVSMVAKRKQIKEGLSRLELAIDGATLLLSGMTMTFPNGDTKEMVLTGVTPNAAIDPAVWTVSGRKQARADSRAQFAAIGEGRGASTSLVDPRSYSAR
jgi:hypothetical protein